MRRIAIDFGTTRTKVATLDAKDEPRLLNLGIKVPWFIPSLFYIGPDGNFLVGEDAQQILNRDPKGIVRGLKTQIHLDIKIRKNGQRVDRIELASKLFKWIKNKCEETVFHDDKISSCVLTVPPPPSFDQIRIDSIKKAALLGGFEHIDVIEEPIAAARHWLSYSQTEDEFSFVLDIGGGTSDLALVKREDNGFSIFSELPPRSLPKGGNDIDDKIWEALSVGDVDGAPLPGFLVKVMMAKEAFTSTIKKFKNIEFNLFGQHIKVPREIVRNASEAFTETLIDFLGQFISDADTICGDIIKNTPILLVGGGYNIMGLKETVEKIWPNGKVFIWEQSEFATVLGAVQSTSQTIKELTPEILYIEKLNEVIKDGELIKEKVGLLLEYADSVGVTPIARRTIEMKILGQTIEDWLRNRELEENARELYNKAIQEWEAASTSLEYESVAFLCKIVLQFDSKHWKAAYLSVLTRLELHQYQQANNFLSAYMENNSAAKELYFLRGLVRHKEGQRLSKDVLHRDAYDDFMKVLSSTDIDLPTELVSPINEFPLIYVFIASIAYTQNNVEDSKNYLQKYIRIMESQRTSLKGDDLLKLYFSKIIISMVIEKSDLEHSINYSKEAFDILQYKILPNNLEETSAATILGYTAWNDWFSGFKTHVEMFDYHADYFFQSLMKKHSSLTKAADDFIELSCNGSNTPYFKEDGTSLLNGKKEFIIAIAEALAKRKYNKLLDDLLEYLFDSYPFPLLSIIVGHSAVLQHLNTEKWRPTIMYSLDYGISKDRIVVANASEYFISSIKVSAKYLHKTGTVINFTKNIELAAYKLKSLPVNIPKSGIRGRNITKCDVSIDFKYKSRFSNCVIRKINNAEMNKTDKKFTSLIKSQKKA